MYRMESLVTSVNKDKFKVVCHKTVIVTMSKIGYCVVVGCHCWGQINSLASPTCTNNCKTPC